MADTTIANDAQTAGAAGQVPVEHRPKDRLSFRAERSLRLKTKRRDRPTPRSKSLAHIGGICLTVVGVMLALSEYEAARMDRRRDAVERQYSDILEGLGSSSEVVRIGAIGRIPRLVTSPVPLEDRPLPWEGALYFAGLHTHPSGHPFHEDILRVISGIVSVSKNNDLATEREGEATISMLCELGANGWYKAQPRQMKATRNECLAWVWQSAPVETITRRPSYDLFQGSTLIATNFDQMAMKRAQFSEARLSGCSFQDTDLQHAYFQGARVTSTSFQNSILAGATFADAVLDSVDFAGADLREADFTGARLHNVNLRNARNLHLARGLSQSALRTASSAASQ